MPQDGSIPGWGHNLQNCSMPLESMGKLHCRDVADPAEFDIEHFHIMVAGGFGMLKASVRQEGQRKMGTGRIQGDYIGPGTSKNTDYDAAVTDRTCGWLADYADQDQP